MATRIRPSRRFRAKFAVMPAKRGPTTAAKLGPCAAGRDCCPASHSSDVAVTSFQTSSERDAPDNAASVSSLVNKKLVAFVVAHGTG